jgi:hypothetical protein
MMQARRRNMAIRVLAFRVTRQIPARVRVGGKPRRVDLEGQGRHMSYIRVKVKVTRGPMSTIYTIYASDRVYMESPRWVVVRRP